MDNISKALLMAGGVLIAVAVIGVAVYSYSVGRTFAQVSNDRLSVAEVQSFNRFYNSYKNLNGGKIQMYDVVNILNRAQVDNVKIDSYPAGSIKKNNGRYEISNTNMYLNAASIEITGYDDSGRVTNIALK